MPFRRAVVCLLLLSAVRTWAAAPAPPPGSAPVRLAADVAVRLDADDACLAVGVWMGGDFRKAVNENGSSVDSNLSHEFRIVQHGQVLATGRASLRSDGKACKFVTDLLAHRQLRTSGLGYRLTLGGDSHVEKGWKTDDAAEKFPKKPNKRTLKKGKTRTFTIESSGRVWKLAFAAEMDYAVRDLRAQGHADFEITFVPTAELKLAAKAATAAVCTITAEAGAVRAEARSPVRIQANDNWTVLDGADDVKPSTALDFSRLSRKPVAGRQYGVRVTGSRVLPDDAAATLVAKQYVRRGMTSVEVADFSNLLFTDAASFRLDRDALLAFDGFVRTLKKEGLSLVCDFQDSRSRDWTRLGVTRPDGRKDPADARLASALGAFSERANDEWKLAAAAFYAHKPFKSRRAFGEDAALSGVNLGSGLFGVWRDLATVPEVVKAYSDWLTAKRKDDPDFMKGSVCEPLDLQLFSVWDGRCGAVRRFLAEREAALMKDRSQYLGELKVKAPRVAAPGNADFKDVALLRGEEGDVFATSFAIDPPQALGEKYRYPHIVKNVNPFAVGEPVPASLGWHQTKDRALGIVSWTAPSPSSWRAGVGLYLGAKAAKEKWAILFRGDGADPMTRLFDRAIAMLYLRGDFAADDPSSALVFKDGGFTVTTPRTCGGFTPSVTGTIASGCLEAKLAGAPAAIWISSLSERPLEKAKRLLLTHATDIQRGGSLFADSTRRELLAVGTGYVMRNGSAAVRIRGLEKPRSCHVVALKSDGTRSKAVKARVEDGDLLFDIAVCGETGARTTYEIFKD